MQPLPQSPQRQLILARLFKAGGAVAYWFQSRQRRLTLIGKINRRCRDWVWMR
ncbi:MAG TPA: hypothetical protein VE715_00010 [Blastocatellia bacterium]|nr:hypothetical protein [Blastocatellia bacterium]